MTSNRDARSFTSLASERRALKLLFDVRNRRIYVNQTPARSRNHADLVSVGTRATNDGARSTPISRGAAVQEPMKPLLVCETGSGELWE
jgi:hypothetical protein